MCGEQLAWVVVTSLAKLARFTSIASLTSVLHRVLMLQLVCGGMCLSALSALLGAKRAPPTTRAASYQSPGKLDAMSRTICAMTARVARDTDWATHNYSVE